MNRLARNVVLTLFFSYSLFFLGCFIVSLIIFPAKHYLSIFFASWAFNNGALWFIDFFIPLHLTMLLLSFGLFFKDSAEKTESFHGMITLILVLLLVLTLFYTAMREFWKPGIVSNLRVWKEQTLQARQFLEQARAAKKAGLLYEARENYSFFLRIDPQNPEVKDEFRLLNARISSDEILAATGRVEESDETVIDDALNLTQKAEEYMQRGDFFSAHYYAVLAQNLDRQNEQARRIAAQALEEIRSFTPGEPELQEIYDEKVRGLMALKRGDYLEAYYIFHRLRKTVPDAPDVRRFYNEAVNEIETYTFYLDDAQRALSFHGPQEVYFLNRREDNLLELVSFKKASLYNSTWYLEEVEITAWERDTGTILYHLSAPYGTILDNLIITHCIDRDDQELAFTSTYHSGTSIYEDLRGIPLHVDPALFEGVSIERIQRESPWEDLYISGLFTLIERLEDLGRESYDVTLEIIRRLLYPFHLLSFSFLTIGLGWHLRKRTRGNGLVTLLGVLSAPVFVYLAYQMLDHALFTAQGFFLLLTGYPLNLIPLILIEGVFFFGVLFYIAVQTTE